MACVKVVEMGWSVIKIQRGILYLERELRAISEIEPLGHVVHNTTGVINVMRRLIGVNDVLILFNKWLIGYGIKTMHEPERAISTSRLQVPGCIRTSHSHRLY